MSSLTFELNPAAGGGGVHVAGHYSGLIPDWRYSGLSDDDDGKMMGLNGNWRNHSGSRINIFTAILLWSYSKFYVLFDIHPYKLNCHSGLNIIG
jgi:hypothetical protein